MSREKHRPIRRIIVKRVNPYRIPEEGPLTPRLRPVSSVGAIGFHHSFREQDDEDRESQDRNRRRDFR
jgi:hypothetical protein